MDCRNRILSLELHKSRASVSNQSSMKNWTLKPRVNALSAGDAKEGETANKANPIHTKSLIGEKRK